MVLVISQVFHGPFHFQVYGESLFTMSYILKTVTEQLSSNDHYNDVQSFFKNNDPGTGGPVRRVNF